MPNKRQHLLGQLLVGLVPVALPFVFFPFILDPVLAPALLAVAVAVFIGFGYFAIKYPPISSPINVDKRYLLLWSVWLLLNIVSLFYTSNVSDNYFEIARIVLWISLFIGSTYVIHQLPGAVQAFSRGIVIACLAEGLYGFYQIAPNILLLLRNADYSYYVCGTMAHKNLLSSGLMLMLPFAIYGFTRDKGFWRIASYLAFFVSLLDIFILQTRAVWVGLALAVVATAVLTSQLKRKNGTNVWQLERKYKLGIVAFFVAGFLLLAMFQPLAFKRQYERVKTSINFNGPHTQANETIRERFMLWRNTIDMWKDAPVLGKGTASWEIEMPSYGVENTRMEHGYTFFQRPHNDFLWVLSENGIVGLTVYLLIFLLPLYWLVKSIFNSNDDPVLALCMFFGIVAWIGDALFCFPSERNTHVFLLVCMLVIAVSKGSSKFDIAPFRRRVSVVALLLLVPVLVIIYWRIEGEYHTRKLYFGRNAQQYQLMIDEGEKARSPVYQIDPVSAPIVWYEGTAYYSMNNVPDALKCFLASYQLSQYHLPTLNNIGTCYEVMGDKLNALKFYKKALALAPKMEETLLNISAVYYNLHMTDSAYNAIYKCDTASTNPKYATNLNAILNTEIQTLIDSGQLTEAQKAKAMEWKGDYTMLKSLLRGAINHKTPYNEEVVDRLKKYGEE